MKGRWLFVAVSVASLLPILAFLLTIFWMGFWQGSPGDPIVYTLKHYRDLFTDGSTYRTLLNTLGFSSTTVLVALFFAVPTAWLVERTDLPGKNFIYGLVTIGALVPTFFTSMGWVFLLHPRIGLINKYFMEMFGLERAPFNIASLVGMGWVEGLGLSSIAFIMIVATYRSMDPALEEAARVHGLGILRTLRYVTLPLTFPGIIAASIYVFTIGLSAFEVPAIIGMSNKIFYLLDFHLLQNPTAGRAAELRYGRGREQSVGRFGAAIELGLFSHVEIFPSLRGDHRQGIPTAAGRVGPARVGFGLAIPRRLLHHRQAVAISAADLGLAPGLFPAAVLASAGAAFAQEFLRPALGSAFPRRLEYRAADGDGADLDADFVFGDFLDRAALGTQMARDVRCRRVSTSRRAEPDPRHRGGVCCAVSIARRGIALWQLGDSDHRLHHQPDQFRHSHHQ